MFDSQPSKGGDFVYFGTGKPYKISMDDGEFSDDHVEFKYDDNGDSCAVVGVSRFSHQRSKMRYGIPVEATRDVIELLEHTWRTKDLFDEDDDLANAVMMPFLKSLGDVTGSQYVDAPMKQQLRWFHRNVLRSIKGRILIVGDKNARALNWKLPNVTVVTHIAPDVTGKWVTYEAVKWNEYDVIYVMYKSELPAELDEIYLKGAGKAFINPNLDYGTLCADTSGFLAITATRMKEFGREYDVSVSSSDYTCHEYNEMKYGMRYEGQHYLNLVGGDDTPASRYYAVWVTGPALHLNSVPSAIAIVPLVQSEIVEYMLAGSIVAPISGHEEVLIKFERTKCYVYNQEAVKVDEYACVNPLGEWAVCQGAKSPNGNYVIHEVIDSSRTGASSFAQRWSFFDLTHIVMPPRIKKTAWVSCSTAKEVYDNSPRGILIAKFNQSPGEVPDLSNGIMVGKVRKIEKTQRIKIMLYEGGTGFNGPGPYWVRFKEYEKGMIDIVGPATGVDGSHVLARVKSQATIEHLVASYSQDHLVNMLAVIRNRIDKGFVLGRFEGSSSHFGHAPDIRAPEDDLDVVFDY